LIAGSVVNAKPQVMIDSGGLGVRNLIVTLFDSQVV
jgi:hypothetical protein